jgi:hypothetical protein
MGSSLSRKKMHNEEQRWWDEQDIVPNADDSTVVSSRFSVFATRYATNTND